MDLRAKNMAVQARFSSVDPTHISQSFLPLAQQLHARGVRNYAAVLLIKQSQLYTDFNKIHTRRRQFTPNLGRSADPHHREF